LHCKHYQGVLVETLNSMQKVLAPPAPSVKSSSESMKSLQSSDTTGSRSAVLLRGGVVLHCLSDYEFKGIAYTIIDKSRPYSPNIFHPGTMLGKVADSYSQDGEDVFSDQQNNN
jgi:hypothetical protein